MGNIINWCKNTSNDGCYYKGALLHRDGDLPAVTLYDGTQMWYKDGKLHRDNDMPAVICPGKYVKYFIYGYQCRSDDLPTVVRYDGTEEWVCNDGYHRDDGPAVISKNGSLEWWKDGYTYTPEMKKL